MKKTIALLLAVCMAVSLLTGCGGGIEQYDDPETEVTPAPEEDAAPADGETLPAEPDASASDTAEPAETADPGLGYAAFEPDTVVASFNGRQITWREYYHWLSYWDQYIQYMSAMGLAFSGWDGHDLSEERDNAAVVRDSASANMFSYHAMEELAEQEDVTLEDEQDQLQAIFDQNADSYVGDGDGTCSEEEAAGFEEYLDEQFIDRELFDYLNRVGLLADAVFAKLYGEEGADYPDEDVLSYAREQDIMAAKHILLMTVDTATGEALSEEDAAAKKEEADAIYEQLSPLVDDAEALEAQFDTLMAEKSEDTGLAAYPDGYTFGPGTMVQEFADTVAGLEEYGLSEPVASSYGYHVILRLPLDPDGAFMNTDGTTMTLRRAAANADFFALATRVQDAGEVVWEDGFEDLDMAEIFGS